MNTTATAHPDIQYFGVSGTWRKPHGAVRCDIVLRGGDGGFGRGASEMRSGGSGAYLLFLARAADGLRPGELAIHPIAASQLPAEVTVTVGRGGQPGGRDGYAVIITHCAVICGDPKCEVCGPDAGVPAEPPTGPLAAGAARAALRILATPGLDPAAYRAARETVAAWAGLPDGAVHAAAAADLAARIPQWADGTWRGGADIIPVLADWLAGNGQETVGGEVRCGPCGCWHRPGACTEPTDG